MSNHARLPVNRSQVRNRILLALPEQEFQNIFRHLAFVELRQGQVLYNTDNWIDYAYFMNSGMASSVSVSAEGRTVEDGTVGHEGLMGGPAALGECQIFCSGIVQIPGNAMRIDAQGLKYEFKHNAGFSKLLLDYIYDRRLHLGQSGECKGLHSLEQRLCCLLLMSQDCARLDSFPFTYEFLSHIVGATRAEISLAAGSLHEAGVISFRRSCIRIVDREEMERRTCRCYQISAHKYGQPASLGKSDIAPHSMIKADGLRCQDQGLELMKEEMMSQRKSDRARDGREQKRKYSSAEAPSRSATSGKQNNMDS
jgi:CRP-like cAMP-binding protein